MRPGESIKVQQDRLSVLNLREMNRKLAWHIEVKRYYAGEPRYALTRNTRFGFDRELLTFVQRRHQDDLLDGFDPKDRGHLRGLSVGRGGWDRRLAEQKRDVVGSAAEKPDWRRRGGGNEDSGCADNVLCADVRSQQRVGVVQHRLSESSACDKWS